MSCREVTKIDDYPDHVLKNTVHSLYDPSQLIRVCVVRPPSKVIIM